MSMAEMIQAGYEAQKKYCEAQRLPMFADGGGWCFRCGRNVFDPNGGYSAERAGQTLITGCPHCNTSFCE